MLEFYREALTRLGHEVTVARDGHGLVELCRRVQPDLILTDIRMPGLDGVEALKEVWKERSVPALLVSACPPADLAWQAPASVLLLRKPVSLADLERAIGQVLGRLG